MTRISEKKQRKRYQIETPDLLLDSAENLFSRMSYESVTLAKIAEHANGNVGQIVYHFGTKSELFRACILRRATVLSNERRILLSNYIQLVGKKNVAIGPLIRAFVDPFFAKVLGSDEGWHNYALLLARVVWQDNASRIIAEGFDEVATMFLENVHHALPGLTTDDGVRGFQFLLGIIYSSVSDDKRIELLSKGNSTPLDYRAYYETLIPFVTAGFSELAREHRD